MNSFVRSVIGCMAFMALVGCETQIPKLVSSQNELLLKAYDGNSMVQSGGITNESPEYNALLHWARQNQDGWLCLYAHDVAPHLLVLGPNFTLNVTEDDAYLQTRKRQCEKPISTDEYEMFREKVFNLKN